TPDRDLTWVCDALGDTTRDIGERTMLLEAAICLSPDRDTWEADVGGLRHLIVDESSLVNRIDEWLKPSKDKNEHHHREEKYAERKKMEEAGKAKNFASWVQFWREVAKQPEDVFSSEKGRKTAWNLWLSMRNDGDESRSSGWNRR